MTDDDFTGDSKLARPQWKQILNDFGHTGIALAAAYVTVLAISWPMAYFGSHRLGYPLAVLAGLVTGYSALVFRETLQFFGSTPHKLHWKDRLRDVLPGPAGAIGGALAWLTASRFFF